MVKRVLTLIICFCLLAVSNKQVVAFEKPAVEAEIFSLDIRPYMDYISRTTCFFNVNSTGKATVSCTVYGYAGTTTKVSITTNLQQHKNGSWATIETFTKSENSHQTALSESTTVSKGYNYRVVAEVKAYSGSNVETRNLTSSEVAY